MIGLLFLAFFVGYFWIAIIAVKTAMAWSKKRGGRPWIAGTFVGLIFYMGLFWDHIPTLVLFKYHCNQDAGFHVYQTVEEWVRENPDAAASLTKFDSAQMRIKGESGFLLNERFKVDSEHDIPIALSISMNLRKIIDRKTDKVLAEYIDYTSGGKSIMLGIDSISQLKPWLGNSTCSSSVKEAGIKGSRAFRDSVRALGESK